MDLEEEQNLSAAANEDRSLECSRLHKNSPDITLPWRWWQIKVSIPQRDLP